MEIGLEKPERHPLVQSMTVVFHLEKKKTLDTAQNETLPSQSIFRTKNR